MHALRPTTELRLALLKTGRAYGELLREHQNWGFAEADLALFDGYLACSPADGRGFIGRTRSLVKSDRRPSAVDDYRFGFELRAAPEPGYFSVPAQALAADAQTAEVLRSLDEEIKKFGPVAALAGTTNSFAAEEVDWKPSQIVTRSAN